MKQNTSILIKTTALVLVFVLLLGVGIMSLSFSHGGVKPNDNGLLTPEHAVAAPTAQELLQQKFDAYNTVTEENGKRIVTIFSKEQTADIRNRRENGEWFWLSSEEMLFLIRDTVNLFETYDEVYIRDLEGNLQKYYGLSFFSSEEYFASFGGFDLGVRDASFDLKKDVYETIIARANVLNSAVYDGSKCFTDLDFEPTAIELYTLQRLENPWNVYTNPSARNISFGYWDFYHEKIRYISGINNRIFAFASMEGAMVYPMFADTIPVGAYKYDRTERNIVIELYETKSDSLLARIRLNEKQHEKEIDTIESLFMLALDSIENTRTVTQNSEYRAAVYLNSFYLHGESTPPILYCPDGNIDLYSFTDDHAVLETKFSLNGGSRFAEYINELLQAFLA